MPDEKTFCGQLKTRATKFGDAHDVLLFDSDIQAITDQQAQLIADGKPGPVRLSFIGKRNPKNDWTHYGVIDRWEPRKDDPAPAADAAPEVVYTPSGDDGNDGLPF